MPSSVSTMTPTNTTTSSSLLLTIFSTTRLAFGTISLLAPSPVLTFCHLLSPNSSLAASHTTAHLPTRLFGIRDAVLGALLYTADTPCALRRALIAGMVVDAVDVFSCVYGVLRGEISLVGAEIVAGGAVVFFICGVGGLRGLWGKKEGGVVLEGK